MSTAEVVESDQWSANPELRTVTVRMPAELHEALKRLARRKHESMNRLCVETLALLVRGEADQNRRCPPYQPDDEAGARGQG